MAESLDQLLNAEFKEAFDEFDKVAENSFIRPSKNPDLTGWKWIHIHKRTVGSDEVDGTESY